MKRAFLLLLVALTGCGGSPTGKATKQSVDPAIASALADPLMADPQLDRRSNEGALRPVDQPYQAMVPPGSPDPLRGEGPATIVARTQAALPKQFAACSFSVGYSYGWAARLPLEIELSKDAEVVEAAGSDVAGCGLRLVAFTSPSSPDTIIDTYRRAAKGSGYTLVEQQARGASVLSARRARDGAAFQLSVFSAASGSAVDLASNRGR